MIGFATDFFKLRSLRQQMSLAIEKIIPGISIPTGSERLAVDNAITRLEQELKELGSPAKTSPLDALLEVSHVITKMRGVSVTSVSIDGVKLQVEGLVPDFTVREKLGREFERRSKFFCSVKESSPRREFGAQNQKSFVFALTLC
jgi:hypothetical protein